MLERIAAGLALAVMVLGAVALAMDSYSRHQGQHREHEQPAVTKQQHGPPSPAVANPGTGKESHKGKQEGGWQDKFLDHLPDWFVALFTGLLVFVTLRLVTTTGDLRRSTDKLWEAGERQIEVARQAAEAAKASAKIANDSLTKLQRAFVVLKQLHRGEAYRERHPSGPRDDLDEQFVAITVELENSGATPTRHFLTQVNFSKFEKAGIPADFAYLDADFGSDPVSYVIGPRTSSRLAEFGISFRTLVEIQNGEAQGYMWGWAEYDDIFDGTPRRRTEFCLKITKVITPISAARIEWGAHDHHNGMDEDCPAERWQTVKGGAFKEPRRPKMPRT